jgi:hypothetical protein
VLQGFERTDRDLHEVEAIVGVGEHPADSGNFECLPEVFRVTR